VRRHREGREGRNVPHRRVKEHAVRAVVARVGPGVAAERGLAGELRQVGVELVKVFGLEFRVGGQAAGAVEFRVDDEFAIGVFEGDVRLHFWEEGRGGGVVGEEGPLDVLAAAVVPRGMEVASLEVGDEGFEEPGEAGFDEAVAAELSGFEGAIGFADGGGLEQEAADAEEEAVEPVVAVDGHAVEVGQTRFDEGNARHALGDLAGGEGEVSGKARQAGGADEGRFEELVCEDVGREFVVGADGDAAGKARGGERGPEFELAAEGAEGSGLGDVVVVQPLFGQMHTAARQHVRQQFHKPRMIVRVHPDERVHFQLIPSVAKQVVQVRNRNPPRIQVLLRRHARQPFSAAIRRIASSSLLNQYSRKIGPTSWSKTWSYHASSPLGLQK